MNLGPYLLGPNDAAAAVRAGATANGDGAMNQPLIPFIPRGQAEISRGGMEREYKLVVKHTLLLLVYVMCLIFPVLVSWVLIIGPGLGYVAVALGILWATAKTQAELEDTARWWVIGLGASATMLWLFGGSGVVEACWPPVRCAWPGWAKVLYVGWTGAGLAVLWLAVFRSSYEIVDPNWSPTISVRPAEWGILWPWNQPIIEEEEDEEPVSPTIESLPRPVPNYGNRAIASQAREVGDLYNCVIAPSGRVVQVSTLLEYAGLAHRIGAVYETWKDRRVYNERVTRWDLDLWQDVVDVWAIFGVVTERQKRTKTRVLVTDPRESAARLREILDVDSPTPPQ